MKISSFRRAKFVAKELYRLTFRVSERDVRECKSQAREPSRLVIIKTEMTVNPCMFAYHQRDKKTYMIIYL